MLEIGQRKIQKLGIKNTKKNSKAIKKKNATKNTAI